MLEITFSNGASDVTLSMFSIDTFLCLLSLKTMINEIEKKNVWKKKTIHSNVNLDDVDVTVLKLMELKFKKKLFVAKVLLGINNVVIKIGCHMHN